MSVAASADVKIDYHYFLEDAVRDYDPAIIDAAKQAIIEDDLTFPNRYITVLYIDFFEIKEINKNTCEVRYRDKVKESDSYELKSFCFVTVEKQKDGSYRGYIIRSSGPSGTRAPNE